MPANGPNHASPPATRDDSTRHDDAGGYQHGGGTELAFSTLMKTEFEEVDELELQHVSGGAGGQTTVNWAKANPAFQLLAQKNAGKPLVEW
jgi:bacteriocin-like protein